MKRSISIIFVAILCFTAFASVHASGVHKWVDEAGVTHYSDVSPDSNSTMVTFIEVPSSYSKSEASVGDYYSITNQWKRLHAERLEREKIKLEKAKLKAAQKPVTPQVVYVNEPERERYVIAYPPRFFHKKFKHHRRHHGKHKKDGHHRKKHAEKALAHKSRHNSYSRKKSRGLTLEIH